jgi:hypothetical protein
MMDAVPWYIWRIVGLQATLRGFNLSDDPHVWSNQKHALHFRDPPWSGSSSSKRLLSSE